jgi:hypothetical protein
MLIIPALGRLRQEDSEFKAGLNYNSEFKASLSYVVRPCLKTTMKRVFGDIGTF